MIEVEKRRYLRAFGAAFLLGGGTRLLSAHLDSYAGAHPPGWLIAVGIVLGVAAIAASLWFCFRSYRFAKLLDYGTGGAVAFGVFALLPLLNLVSVLLLLAKHRKVARA